jgi:hypothetical protein
MAEATEILVSLIEENWNHIRHSEDQRATITNLIVIVVSIIQGVLTQTGFTKNALPLTILLVLLGFYGLVTTAKLHERSRFHIKRARKFRDRLDTLCPDAQINLLQKLADEEHQSQHLILAKKVRLSSLWLALHIFIALLGTIYTVIIFIK